MGWKKLRRLEAPPPWPSESRPERWARTFDEIRPHLPERCAAFIDIGCGTGGIAIHMAKHYPGAVAHLIDGTKTAPRWGGYREDGKPWDDVGEAKKFVLAECPGADIRAHPPDPSLTLPCDLIYSICSWGHHYPIEIYLGLAVRSLRPGRALIVDLRLAKGGLDAQAKLGEYFDAVGIIKPTFPGRKYLRTVWRAR